MSDLASQIQSIADELAIRELVARFANACSPPDLAAFEKLWTADAEIEPVWSLSHPFEMSEAGIPAIIGMMDRLLKDWDFFVQLVHSGVVEVDDGHDKATGRWILREVAKGPNETYYNNFAIYEDQYRKVRGKWFFLRRDYRYMFLDSGAFQGEICPPVRDWYGQGRK
jgi:hypothetical protein